MTKQETIVRTIAQVIGGVAVFRLIQVLWGIEIAETHVGRSHSAIYNVCTADLAGEGRGYYLFSKFTHTDTDIYFYTYLTVQ